MNREGMEQINGGGEGGAVRKARTATRREMILGTFSFFWQPTPGSSCWPEHRLTAVSGGRNINA